MQNAVPLYRNAGTAEKISACAVSSLGIQLVTVVDGVDTASHANKKPVKSTVWSTNGIPRSFGKHPCRLSQEDGGRAVFGQLCALWLPQEPPVAGITSFPDAETAPVVEEIYDLYLSGLSCKMIGERLTAQGIPTPSEMKRARGEDLGRRSSAAWSKGTIRKILQNPVYLGHMVQGKEEKISFKEKKTRELPQNQWIVVEHTHEAIIKEEIFGDVKNEWQSAGSPEQG